MIDYLCFMFYAYLKLAVLRAKFVVL